MNSPRHLSSYMNSTFDEIESLADCLEAGGSTPTRVWTVVRPPAPAAQNLGMGLRRTYRGQTEQLFRT
jgi:hypothetical protein